VTVNEEEIQIPPAYWLHAYPTAAMARHAWAEHQRQQAGESERERRERAYVERELVRLDEYREELRVRRREADKGGGTGSRAGRTQPSGATHGTPCLRKDR
jgi:hypothetical protein